MNNIEKPKIDNVNNKGIVPKHENHAYVVIGPRNVGKIYYMLKVLEKICDKRPIHIITRSPNQYPKYHNNISFITTKKMVIKTNLLEDYVNFVDNTKKRNKSYGYVQIYLSLY